MKINTDRPMAEARFRRAFVHLGAVSAYARRRGSSDPEGIAAEVMAIAWRKLSVVPQDDARPWLFATARNLLYEERRKRARTHPIDPHTVDEACEAIAPAPRVETLDPQVTSALEKLNEKDREALLLVAWEDLSPDMAAKALGIKRTAFRVRLHRARKKFQQAYEERLTSSGVTVQIHPHSCLEMEKS